jgi:hypothetical protein
VLDDERCHVLDDERCVSLSACRGLITESRDQVPGLGLAAPQAGDPQRNIGPVRRARRLACHADLVEHRLGGSQLAGRRVDVAEHAEGKRDGGERSYLAGTLEFLVGEPSPGLVIPEIRRGPQRQREPTGLLWP